MACLVRLTKRPGVAHVQRANERVNGRLGDQFAGPITDFSLAGNAALLCPSTPACTATSRSCGARWSKVARCTLVSVVRCRLVAEDSKVRAFGEAWLRGFWVCSVES